MTDFAAWSHIEINAGVQTGPSRLIGADGVRLDADKERARALAIRLWPASRHFERKRDHGRAEAALLARFGAETLLPIGEAAE